MDSSEQSMTHTQAAVSLVPAVEALPPRPPRLVCPRRNTAHARGCPGDSPLQRPTALAHAPTQELHVGAPRLAPLTLLPPPPPPPVLLAIVVGLGGRRRTWSGALGGAAARAPTAACLSSLRSLAAVPAVPLPCTPSSLGAPLPPLPLPHSPLPRRHPRCPAAWRPPSTWRARHPVRRHRT